MHQFYISNDNVNDVQRCNESLRAEAPIVITGLTIEGQRVQAFRGIVQSVDDDSKRGQGRRYKVTIRD
jgi:hypothetical protein